MSDEQAPPGPNRSDLSVVIWEKLDPLRGRAPLASLKYRRDDGWDDAPPKRKPGDLRILGWASAGMAMGAGLGMTAGFFTLILGIVTGGVAGALLASHIRFPSGKTVRAAQTRRQSSRVGGQAK